MATLSPAPAPAAAPADDRSPTVRALLWLEGLLALGAYGGAIALILGVVDLAEATSKLPFGGSTVFAGIMLGLVNGVLPTLVVIAARQRRPTASLGHLAVGVALMAWIVVQIAVLGPPIAPIQVVYFAYGLLIAVLAVRLLRTPAAGTRG
jgi:hypothetical protein